MCLLHQRPGTRCRRVARIPALAAPKHDWEGDQRQLIDETCGKQRLIKHAAALDEQVWPIAGFEARNSFGGIADRRWLVFHVIRRSDDVTTCFRTALNVSPIGWSPLWGQ